MMKNKETFYVQKLQKGDDGWHEYLYTPEKERVKFQADFLIEDYIKKNKNLAKLLNISEERLKADVEPFYKLQAEKNKLEFKQEISRLQERFVPRIIEEKNLGCLWRDTFYELNSYDSEYWIVSHEGEVINLKQKYLDSFTYDSWKKAWIFEKDHKELGKDLREAEKQLRKKGSSFIKRYNELVDACQKKEICFWGLQDLPFDDVHRCGMERYRSLGDIIH